MFARSAADVCREYLARIAAVDPSLHAFNAVTADVAVARAEAIDRDIERWRDAPLVGVPIAIKDTANVAGVHHGSQAHVGRGGR